MTDDTYEVLNGIYYCLLAAFSAADVEQPIRLASAKSLDGNDFDPDCDDPDDVDEHIYLQWKNASVHIYVDRLKYLDHDCNTSVYTYTAMEDIIKEICYRAKKEGVQGYKQLY